MRGVQIRQLATTAACGLSLGCQLLADPGVDYAACLSAPNGEYSETFARPQVAAGHCWQIQNVEEPGYVQEADNDLIIHPSGDTGSQWLDEQQGAFFFHEVEGDFLAVARAEAVSGVPAGDHCLNANEAAGLVVRRRAPLAWTALLVRPSLSEAELMDPTKCGDELPAPPRAQVEKSSYGFGSDVTDFVSDVGHDAEADIALCRKDDQLFYYVQDFEHREDAPPEHANLRAEFHDIEVGYGPLDIGLTATASAGRRTLPEGHFSWLFLHAPGSPLGDNCSGALEAFVYPEDE